MGAAQAKDAELFRTFRKETPEEHLERLLAEADRDMAAGNVTDMRADLENMKAAYGL